MAEFQPGDIIHPNYIERASWFERPITRRTALVETAGGILVGAGLTKLGEIITTSELPVTGIFADVRDEYDHDVLSDGKVNGAVLLLTVAEKPGAFTSINIVEFSFSYDDVLPDNTDNPGGWPEGKVYKPGYAQNGWQYYLYALDMNKPFPSQPAVSVGSSIKVGVNVFGRFFGIEKRKNGTPYATFQRV